MFYANNSSGSLVSIDNSNKEEKYYCPICGSELVRKMGEVKVHHYSHKSSKDCDSFSEPMTEWHKEWQAYFPEECREITIKEDDELHRADVFVNNYVVEVQHSPISSEKISERCKFYNRGVRKLLWVFDRVGKDNITDWIPSWQTYLFGNVNPFHSGVEIYDKVMPLLYKNGVLEVAFDCGRYVIYCYNLNMSDDLGKVSSGGSVVLSKELFSKSIMSGDIEKLKTGVELSNDVIEFYKESVRNMVNRQSGGRGAEAVFKKGRSSLNLLSMIGDYTIEADRLSGDGVEWKAIKNSRGRMFSSYLDNCDHMSRRGVFDVRCSKLKYGNPRVVRISLPMVCEEIRRVGYLDFAF